MSSWFSFPYGISRLHNRDFVQDILCFSVLQFPVIQIPALVVHCNFFFLQKVQKKKSLKVALQYATDFINYSDNTIHEDFNKIATTSQQFKKKVAFDIKVCLYFRKKKENQL